MTALPTAILTDDNTGFANTTFDKSSEVVNVGGQQVRVVGAWKKIVQGGTDPNGPAKADGTGAEFAVHFNVATQADNRGLLRHEMIHGRGAVGTGPWFSMSKSNVLSGPMPGDRKKRDLYDLQLVDLSGKLLHAEYDATDQTFKVQNYSIEKKYTDWTDGDAGLFFRGKAADGKTKDMSLGTFPGPSGGAQLRMNEVTEVMSASSHPTWNTIQEPDRLFFCAMGYNLAK